VDEDNVRDERTAHMCRHRLHGLAQLTRKGLAVKRITGEGEEEERVADTGNEHKVAGDEYPQARFKIGELVEVNYKKRGKYYPGKIDKVRLAVLGASPQVFADGGVASDDSMLIFHPSSNDSFEAALKVAKEQKLRVVIDFFATWCDPCIAIKPVLNALAEVRPDIVFMGVDVDLCSVALEGVFDVSTMPTFITLDDTGKIVGRVVGTDAEGLQRIIDDFPVQTELSSDARVAVWDCESKAAMEKQKKNVFVVPRYDIAYLDGDFEADVDEDAIQHRHKSRWAAISSIVSAYDQDPQKKDESVDTSAPPSSNANAHRRRPRPEIFSVTQLQLGGQQNIDAVLNTGYAQMDALMAPMSIVFTTADRAPGSPETQKKWDIIPLTS